MSNLYITLKISAARQKKKLISVFVVIISILSCAFMSLSSVMMKTCEVLCKLKQYLKLFPSVYLKFYFLRNQFKHIFVKNYTIIIIQKQSNSFKLHNIKKKQDIQGFFPIIFHSRKVWLPCIQKKLAA